MNKPFFNFPEEGCFMGRSENVENYLKANKRPSITGTNKADESIGIAWNEDSYWYFKMKSGKKIYTYEQLLDGNYVKNKPQFEVGKWYKNLGYYKNYIAKFSGWFDSTSISVSEFIYKGKLNGPCKNFSSDIDFAEQITDLSEIQQYLPDGHVDKQSTIPEYVECINNGKSYSSHTMAVEKGATNYAKKDCENGKIYKVKNSCVINGTVDSYCLEDEKGLHYLIGKEGVVSSTKEEFEKQNSVKMTKEELIEEAKRRYPVGTVFKCAWGDLYGTVETENFNFDEEDGDIFADISAKGGDGEYVYSKGKWAEIISKPKEEKWIPKVGDWVFTDMYNTSGFKEDCVQVIFVDEIALRQPNFKIRNKDNQEIWCYPASNNTSFVRKALPHEIPNNVVKAYTAEEALIEIQKLGLEVGDEIYYRTQMGTLDYSNIIKIDYLPRIKTSLVRKLIDCGNGYLWHENFPERIADSSIIHKKAKPKYKENTVGYWLDKLNEPERSLALGYAEENFTINCTNFFAIGHALGSAFNFDKTKEGYEFWDSIRIKNNVVNSFDFQKEALAKGIKAHEAFTTVETNSNSTVDSILQMLDKYIVKQPVVLEEFKPIVLHKLKSLI